MTTRRILQSVLLLGVAGLLAILVWFILSSGTDDADASAQSGDPQVVREDSHVINQAPDEKAVLVEFLDFECEVCRAYYPTVEQLREQYSDELTLVIRYFPIPSHANANNAAIAVEAAARQGELEAMYQQMYATQADWGEARDSKAHVFRGFAEEMGLDMAQYDADVADPKVAARVQRDFDEGRALGVGGTPTFFLDGEKVSVENPGDLTRAVEAALAQ
ncbi:DsbA family protein [Cellulosimicrobium funkei]|uniref:Disulfide bond formation protein DsbA n=1 Tax=Cellulosimicrobium funkei TaxID=264251 RepID=A0A4Y8QXN9_9MICO|nr:thioredoxin domain-containing protein [Cellulosimicrobium funkei]TFF04417.1 disulfide bond formation protein DsbA [Cellulosimicrobium funkei]TGA67918.1 disulfide bond formation protein DsbA [Cellulosimicrobium terreum]